MTDKVAPETIEVILVEVLAEFLIMGRTRFRQIGQD